MKPNVAIAVPAQPEPLRGDRFVRRLARLGAVVGLLVGPLVSAAFIASPALGAPNLAWSASTIIDGGSFLSGVSCASSSFCAAVDNDGDALTWDGTSWSSEAIDPEQALDAVSCTAANFCIAVDNDGNAFSWDGTTWSSAVDIDPGNDITALSCSSVDFCIAVEGPKALTWNGATWSSAIVDSSNGLDAVSCTSSSFCAAGDSNGETFTWDGVTWSAPDDIDGVNPLGLSCGSATFCVAVDGNGDAFTWDGETWSGSNDIDGSQMLTGVSCASANFCVVVDGDGAALTWDGETWSEPTSIDGTIGMTGVSCPSPSFCGAVEYDGGALTGSTTVVSRLPQAISFTSVPPTGALYTGSNDQSYRVSATGGGSGLPVTFSVDANSTSGCAISGSIVSFGEADGTCVIDANQAGDTDFVAAPEVEQSFSIVGGLPEASDVQAVPTPNASDSATVSWAPPSLPDGPQVTGYTVTPHDLTTGMEDVPAAAGPNASSLTLGGLSAGDAYDFQVSATSSNGNSAPATSNSVLAVGVAPVGTSVGTSTSPLGVATAGVAVPGAASIGASASGAGELVVGVYPSDPLTQIPTPLGTVFFDVRTMSLSTFTTAQVTFCGDTSGAPVEVFDPVSQHFVPVRGAQEALSSDGCMTITLDAQSTPSIKDLMGTVFAVPGPATPELTVSASGHLVFGALVTYTAHVIDPAGAVNGGTVLFGVGKQTICRAKVAAGAAECRSRKAPSAGRAVLEASYSGAAGVRASRHGSEFRIRPDSAVVKVTASALAGGFWRAQVTVVAGKPGSGVPTGDVVFRTGKLRYTVVLQHRGATIVLRVAVGQDVSVSYVGNDDFDPAKGSFTG